MSKVIANVRSNAIRIAADILKSEGIDGIKLRTIASECGVAVGTLYNYFPSKEYLIGCVVLEDWNNAYDLMRSGSEKGSSARECLRSIYGIMCGFAVQHEYLYSYSNWDSSGKYTHANRHEVLVNAIKVLIEDIDERFGLCLDESITVFLCESVINSSVKHYSFEQIEPAFIKILS